MPIPRACYHEAKGFFSLLSLLLINIGMHDNEMGAENKCDCGEDCHCHGGMKSQWRMMKAVRMLTAVIIIIFVFWCGFEFGEIRATVGRGFGSEMMRGYSGGPTIEYGMMRSGVTTSVSGAPASLNAVAVPAQAGGGGTNVQ
jgi:hypothetical protein